MDWITRLLQSPDPARWLFYGDSITHGVRHTYGHRDYPQLFAERLRFELNRRMDVVINTAISGNTTRSLLQGFDWRVAQFRPHVVFLMIGMNDCSAKNDMDLEEFVGNLNELADRIGALEGLAVLQTTCPILPGGAPGREGSFDLYMDAIREVASRRGLPLIDHTAYWRRHADSHFYWMSNAYHPNHFGHRVFVRLLFQSLGIYDPESPCCRLFVP